MKITIQRLYDRKGNETGAMLCAPEEKSSDLQQKFLLEARLIQYCVKQLYPDEKLNVFRDTYMGVPSITVIKQSASSINSDDVSVVTH
jgi:hypothetical protein